MHTQISVEHNIGGDDTSDLPVAQGNYQCNSCLVSADWSHIVPHVLLPIPLLISTRRILIQGDLHWRAHICRPICLSGRPGSWLSDFSFVPLHNWGTNSHTVFDLVSKRNENVSSLFSRQSTLDPCAHHGKWSYPRGRAIGSCPFFAWRSSFPWTILVQSWSGNGFDWLSVRGGRTSRTRSFAPGKKLSTVSRKSPAPPNFTIQSTWGSKSCLIREYTLYHLQLPRQDAGSSPWTRSGRRQKWDHLYLCNCLLYFITRGKLSVSQDLL
jgi:hypothetical protein